MSDLTKQRDGFSIRDLKTDEEVHFVASDKNGRMRDKVFEGLVMKVDFDRFYVCDTRDEPTRDQ